jgi:hypothetical protein
VDHRVRVDNTRQGSVSAWVKQVGDGFVAIVDGTEYPSLAGLQAPAAGEPVATSVEAATEALRRALNRN